MGKNLLKISDLSLEEINAILDQAQKIKDGKTIIDHHHKIVANLFFEPSTRTHYSFTTAEYKIGCHPIDFSPSSSSLVKGETFYDTVRTFEMFGVDAIVIRSLQNAWYKELNKINVPLINAGDGSLDHPTQTLLDLLTIKQEFHKFQGLTVLVVGDIVHSRVAHSNIAAMKRLGMKVLISAPKQFQDKQYSYVDFETGLKKADVVNMLRIQNERHTTKSTMSTKEYNAKYGLNNQRLKIMKRDAIIIHPAPVNRNVEMNDDIVECSQSRIFKQIQNGVFIRMAVLDRALKK